MPVSLKLHNMDFDGSTYSIWYTKDLKIREVIELKTGRTFSGPYHIEFEEQFREEIKQERG